MKKITIAKPGYPYLITALVLTVLFYTKAPFLSLPFFFVTLFLAYFFRDPERKHPAGKNLLLSPADGKILKIERVYEPHFIEGEALKVSIFLSLFDVHVTRSPYGGTIPLCWYIPGRFLAAYREEASSRNERNLIGIETDQGKLLVVQVAGLVARRIVCWIKPGDKIESGERIGMIKFGSCTELYIPSGIKLKVKEGDRVRGGETVLGEL
jgi:phosphatidylserine decarboxylase